MCLHTIATKVMCNSDSLCDPSQLQPTAEFHLRKHVRREREKNQRDIQLKQLETSHKSRSPKEGLRCTESERRVDCDPLVCKTSNKSKSGRCFKLNVVGKPCGFHSSSSFLPLPALILRLSVTGMKFLRAKHL